MSSLLSAINASASALDAQHVRMEVAVSNMANADSTNGPNGEPYRRRSVVLESAPDTTFGGALGSQATGVRVSRIVEDQNFRYKQDPGAVDADAEGNVAVPNIDVQTEMVDMVGAARAYQANLSAIGLIRDTVQKALELGKQ
jgi:flagellar basal-body rod protein FlgC